MTTSPIETMPISSPFDPTTGERKWEFPYISPSTSGVLTTASGLAFTGDAEGNVLALDSRSGELVVDTRRTVGADFRLKA